MREGVSNFAKEIGSLNILIMGKTGVGKSTLINAIFGDDTAKTGAGFPVTQYFEKYPIEGENKDSIPINLYDSAGCELGREQGFVNNISNFLETQIEKGIEEQIHIAWYLVSAPSARFEPYEGVIINKLYKKRIPVIIMLSQCDRATEEEINGIIDAIQSLDFKKVYNIVRVSASPLKQLNIEPFGLDDIVSRTTELLPRVLGDAFVARQVVSIKAKRSIAFGYITVAAASCFAAGFTPLPFVTTVAALASQTVLWSQIASLYQLDKTRGMKTLWARIATSKEALSTFSITAIADFFTATFVGGAVAGGTAATFICIVGLALTTTFEELAIKDLDGVSMDEIEKLLQEIFEKNFKKYKSIRIRRKSDLDKLRDEFLKSKS